MLFNCVFSLALFKWILNYLMFFFYSFKKKKPQSKTSPKVTFTKQPKCQYCSLRELQPITMPWHNFMTQKFAHLNNINSRALATWWMRLIIHQQRYQPLKIQTYVCSFKSLKSHTFYISLSMDIPYIQELNRSCALLYPTGSIEMTRQ